jgi:hypothetical protein
MPKAHHEPDEPDNKDANKEAFSQACQMYRHFVTMKYYTIAGFGVAMAALATVYFVQIPGCANDHIAGVWIRVCAVIIAVAGGAYDWRMTDVMYHFQGKMQTFAIALNLHEFSAHPGASGWKWPLRLATVLIYGGGVVAWICFAAMPVSKGASQATESSQLALPTSQLPLEHQTVEPKDIIALIFAAASFVVSASAFTISLIAWFQKRWETQRMIRSQISDVISRMITVEAEIRKVDIQILDAKNNVPNLRSLRNTLSQQQDSLARQGHYLTQHALGLVNDAEYAVLARGFAIAGDTELAEEYWRKAIAKSDGFIQAKHHRSFANFLFSEHESERGRAEFEESIRLLPLVSDNKRWERMWTCLNWAQCEARLAGSEEHDPAKVTRQVDAAREACESLVNEGRRKEGLQRIKEQVPAVTISTPQK